MKTLREFRQSLREARADHDLRHRPSRFGVALSDSIQFVREGDWDAVVPADHVFLSRRYLAALEGAAGSGLQLRYALLYDGTQPVAAAVFQIHAFSGEALGRRDAPEEPSKPTLRKKVGTALRRAADQLTLRVLMCGNAFVTGQHGLAVAPGVDTEEVFDGLAEAIYRVRRADKLHGQVTGVLVKDFYEPPAGGDLPARRLLPYGYREFSVDPQMVVSLRDEWQSFADYVDAMAKKYRARVRSARKKGKGLVRRAMDVAEIEANHGRIRELFLAVHEKASFRIAELPELYFPAMARGLGEDFSMYGYYLEGELVGFTSCIRWGDQLEGHYLGLDYEHNVPNAIYQNILYDDVEEAFARGCREINLGRTALEIKSGIGAEPREVRCFVRHRNPASNAVVKPMFGFVKPTKWTKRNPFGG